MSRPPLAPLNPYRTWSLEELEVRRRDLQAYRAALGREVAAINVQQGQVTAALREAKRAEVLVSDHAVVRYLERVVGYDVESVRRKLAAEATEINARRGESLVVRDGYVLVGQDNRVATVITPEVTRTPT